MLDALIIPIGLAYVFGWMWIFITILVLVLVIYPQYRGYQRLFGPPEQVHHVPSDHIPEFHAAEEDENDAPGTRDG